MRRAARVAFGALARQVPAVGIQSETAICCASACHADSFPLQPAIVHYPASWGSVRHASWATSWWDARFKPRPRATDPTTPALVSDTDSGIQPAAQQEHQSKSTANAADAGSQHTTDPPTEVEVPTAWPLPEDSSEVFREIGQAVRTSDYAAIAAAKADAFFTSSWTMGAITYLHDTQGLPWWASIAAFNLLTKVVTMPITLYSQKIQAATVEANTKMTHIRVLQQAAQQAATPEESQRLQQAAQKAYTDYIANNGNPMQQMMKLPLALGVNGMIFLSVFNGVRALIGSEAFTLTAGGTLWFPDLTHSDPYYGLPLLCALSTWAMVYRGTAGETGFTDAQIQQRKWLRYLFYGMGGLFIPFGGMVPAGVAILWTSNACFSVLQGTLMRNDKFRVRIGLPTMAEIREQHALQARQQQETTKATVAAAGGGVAAGGSKIDNPLDYDPDKAAAALKAKLDKERAGESALGSSGKLFSQDPTAQRKRRATSRRA